MVSRGHRLAAAATAALIAAGSVPAVGADAMPPLRENARINDSLLAAAIGDEIRDNCPTISARMLVVLREMQKLKNYARAAGYSEAEVKAFLKSKEERNRMRGLRDAYLAENGVVTGDAESYCRLGRQEMRDKTLTGTLLRGR